VNVTLNAIVEIREPCTRRQIEVYSLVCWRCRHAVELAANQRPYRCGHCGMLLVIAWPAQTAHYDCPRFGRDKRNAPDGSVSGEATSRRVSVPQQIYGGAET
jgi:DNA-directed RNA polymerase subunit RPC12/RpoP